ncbi:MAG: histidine kinase/HAMP domain-containing protein [Treponematales bacterium]
MKTLNTRPKHSLLNLRSLTLIYALLSALTYFFARTFLRGVLDDGRFPDRMSVAVFLAVPGAFLILLIISGVGIIRDFLALRPGSRFQFRLLAYFAVVVVLTAAPVVMVTGLSIGEATRFWRGIDVNGAMSAARGFAAEAYALKLSRFEAAVRERKEAGPWPPAALPPGAAALQVFRRVPLSGSGYPPAEGTGDWGTGIGERGTGIGNWGTGNGGWGSGRSAAVSRAASFAERRDVSDDGGDVSDDGGDVSDDGGDVSDDGRDVSDERRDVSDGRRDVSDGRRDISDDGGDVSDERGDVSNGRRDVSDDGGDVSDDSRDVANGRGDVSDDSGALPRERGALPRSAGALPADGGALPATVGALPRSAGALPADAGALPADAGVLPADGGALPAGRGVLPRSAGALPADGGGASPAAGKGNGKGTGDWGTGRSAAVSRAASFPRPAFPSPAGLRFPAAGRWPSSPAPRSPLPVPSVRDVRGASSFGAGRAYTAVPAAFSPAGEAALWRETARAGDGGLLLEGPPAFEQGFAPRELPRDANLVRYVDISGGGGVLTVIVFPLGSGGADGALPFDEAAAVIERESARFGHIDSIRFNLRRVLVFYYSVFFLPLLLMTLIIAVSFTRRLTQPLMELTDATRRVAEGDLSIQILARRGDELGHLIQSFNDMVRELQSSQAALVKAEKISLWRTMAQQLAHEIKNPLTPIRLSAERVLRRWKSAPETAGEILEPSMLAIIQEVDGLSTLLTEFRSLSRPMEPSGGTADLRELAEETARPYRASHPGVVIDTSRVEPGVTVKIDRNRLRQVLTNLIANGIEAMRGSGRVEVRSDIVRKHERRYCRLSVRDTGRGMTKEEGEKVFTPYFTTKEEGTGLGLPIVERIVNEHGGAVWFNTAPGAGATFFVDLPLAGEEGPGENGKERVDGG